MNSYEIMGLIHIGAMAVALIAAAVILILKKEKVIKFDRVNSLLFILAALVMIISVMYFIIDYYSEITGIKNCAAAVRVSDAWITVSMLFVWFLLIKNIVFPQRYALFWKLVKAVYAVLLVTNLINYGFIMDENYSVDSEILKKVSFSFELADTAAVIILGIIIIAAIGRIRTSSYAERYIKVFAFLGTILMMADYAQGAKVGIKLITGEVLLHGYNPEAVNITPAIRLLLAVLLLWYIVKHCFLEQYQRPPETAIADKKLLNEEDKLQHLAETAELTERETVIMKLLYAGSTYQDIADYLYISKNTVKHHVTSTYRKLGVTSKMEMINLVRAMEE